MPILRPRFEDPNFFWKNFRLGTELHVSGAFLYDALLLLDKMDNLCYEDECFSFLYNVSVGIERLEKIAIILLEHDTETDQEEFEKSLITHNHLELINRINKKASLKIGKVHNKFLQLIADFYNSYRYDRYNLTSVFHPNQDKSKLVDFVCQELKIEAIDNPMFLSGIAIDRKIRHFIGKVISKIATQLFEIIRGQAFKLGLWTYEIRYNSKAFKIFTSKEYSFDDEKMCQKEILIHLMNNEDSKDEFRNFIKSIKPLDLDFYENNAYARYMFDFSKNQPIVDEIRQIYEDNEFNKERFDNVSIIGEDISFETNEDNDWFDGLVD